MVSLKRRILVVAVVAAMAGANHLEHSIRAAALRRQAADLDSPVLQLASSASGHSSIQIDESSLKNRNFLHFTTLGSWNYDRATSTTCPEAVKAVDGQQVKMLGFMYPLGDPNDLTVFALRRDTQTCCYGPQPQFNQYVFVETPGPVKFERLAPVVVQGRFIIDPQPDQGYIYRMEGGSVRVATGNDQPPSPQDFAKQAGLPIFDFAVLEHIKWIRSPDGRQQEIARQLLPLDGQQVVVHGYVTTRTDGDPPVITIGKYQELKVQKTAPLFGAPVRLPPPAPGQAAGDNPFASKAPTRTPPAGKAVLPGIGPASQPDMYNTVQVSLKNAGEAPPAWWPQAVFKGTIHVTTRPADQRRYGVLSLDDATLAVAPRSTGPLTDTGPILPQSLEVLFLAASVAALFLGFFVKQSANGGNP